MAFAVQAAELDDWRTHFKALNVPIVQEISWPTGGHSIYFRDPVDNTLELCTPNTWYPEWKS